MDEQEKIKSNSLNSVGESVYGTKLFWAVDMIGNPQESPYNGSKKIYKVFLRKEKKVCKIPPHLRGGILHNRVERGNPDNRKPIKICTMDE